jgi:hypothetical protein
MTKQFTVITCRAFCSNGDPISLEYFSDSERFPDREMAVRHGFKTVGCDDFNVGVIDDGHLSDLLWMDKSIGEEPDILAKIAWEVGL